MIRLTKDRAFYRTMLLVALPAALQNLITLCVNLADEMMITRLSGNWFSGVGLTNQISNVFVMTIFGLSSGASVLTAQYWGKRDLGCIKQVVSIAFNIVLALSVLVAFLLWRFPEEILALFTSDGAVIEAAIPYATLFCFSFIPFAISQALIMLLRSVEIVKIGLYVSVVSLVMNVGLNAIFIFGLLGVPAMGARGAALATVLARITELAIIWIYAFHVQKKLPLREKDLFKSEHWLWRDYFRFGIPVALGDMQWAIIGLFKTSIVGHLGGLMISANTIADRMMTLGLLVTNALSVGASVVIGKTVGAGDYDKTREYSVSIQWMFLGFGMIFATLVFLLRGAFVSLYQGTSADVATLAAAMIALGAPTMIGTAYHASCFMGINRGAGDSRFVMYVDMICGWLIVLPISYLAAYIWHVPNAFMFLFLRIDQCFKWLIAFIRLRGNNWIKNVTRESNAGG